MKDLDPVWAIVLIVVSLGIGGFGVEYSKDLVKIACYEAAKTNQNIKCEVPK